MCVCLLVCLFVSNKRQNCWADWAKIISGTSRDARVGTYKRWSNFHKCVLTKFRFLKFWKSTNFLYKSANFFVCFCFTTYIIRKNVWFYNYSNWIQISRQNDWKILGILAELRPCPLSPLDTICCISTRHFRWGHGSVRVYRHVTRI